MSKENGMTSPLKLKGDAVESERLRRQERFVRQLAKFLVGNQAGKSISLQVNSTNPVGINWAREWADLRSTTFLFGYPTEEEAVENLTAFLALKPAGRGGKR